MDEIRVGLDFGTHQTKICVSRIPDEGHGVPEYEFFQFTDQKGVEHFFIPSVVQINNDDTLSYGFVDSSKENNRYVRPVMKYIPPVEEIDIEDETERICEKYLKGSSYDEDKYNAVLTMLKAKHSIDIENNKKERKEAHENYERELEQYRLHRNVYRYFKQATFTNHPWDGKYSSETLSIWYIAYILFLLEKRYPEGFAINMGVPTDDKNYNQMQELGSRILLSAYYLVEEVYHQDLRAFLNEKIDNLIAKTTLLPFSADEKEFNRINIFPEAYASLIGLTSRRKLVDGMSLNADIGGGTTDISFFVVENGKPKIYKYWSLPYGLNYIAEQSGFDYSEGNFVDKAHDDVIDDFNEKKKRIVVELERDLLMKVRSTTIDKSSLLSALKNRVVVYNGGGSIYDSIAIEFPHFNDVRKSSIELWKDEIVKDMDRVSKYVNILTTSYGLSVSEEDSEVELCDFNSLFSESIKDGDYEKSEIDKDVC